MRSIALLNEHPFTRVHISAYLEHVNTNAVIRNTLLAKKPLHDISPMKTKPIYSYYILLCQRQYSQLVNTTTYTSTKIDKESIYTPYTTTK